MISLKLNRSRQEPGPSARSVRVNLQSAHATRAKPSTPFETPIVLTGPAMPDCALMGLDAFSNRVRY
jgi:hypothetical protein